MKEKWLPINGYGGYYEVSNLGEVRSLNRAIPYERWEERYGDKMVLRGRPLKGCTAKDGRRSVTLSKNGKATTKRIHRIVLEAFIGSCPNGMEGCHNDGNPQNNTLNNLRWDTRSANHMDKIKHGTHDRGERNPMAKLVREKVNAIKILYKKTKASQQDLADLFDVSQAHISRIIRGKCWAHME